MGCFSMGIGKFQPGFGACGRCKMARAVFSRTAGGVLISWSKSWRVCTARAASSRSPSFNSSAYSVPRSLGAGLEGGLGADPMVDGGAVDAGILGRGGYGLPSSQGLDDLSLSGRQVGI